MVAAHLREAGNGTTISFFYYEDVGAAIDWYSSALGLEAVLVEDWLGLFRVSGHHLVGLVDSTSGSQRHVEGPNKGAMLSIEVADLEGLFDQLRASGVADRDARLLTGCHGRTREFRVRDPGGYLIEFFRWVDPPAA
jgi:catechol 2,3-dioxygenase-like lactoylglutathione lyase family enzyme